MDLALDVLRLAEKVAQVPGLGMACSLAMQIMQTVQVSKNNTARLQYLAHLVANHLIGIAERMEGKWDCATDTLKCQLDGFEAVLRDISKLVTKYSKSSLVVALMNAGDRDAAIHRMERRLADTQMSVIMCLGVDASLSLQNIEVGIDRLAQSQLSLESQARLVQETCFKVVGLEEAKRKFQLQKYSKKAGDNEIPLYDRHQLRLLRTISRSHQSSTTRGTHVTVALKEAQTRTDGRVVLIRTYEGSDSNERTKMFSRDLQRHTNIWEPIMLQLVGASAPMSEIPFQVYDAPGGQVEEFNEWLNRTLLHNPAETICGLYAMRISIEALLQFEISRDISCRLLFKNSVVHAQVDGNRSMWALIYAGEMGQGHLPWTVHDEYRFMPSFIRSEAPACGVAEAFGRGSKFWADGTQDLGTLFNPPTQDFDLPTLTAALLENGWLGPCSEYFPPSTIVGLGDVGYTKEDGHFVVVSNLHSLLTSADGAALTWTTELSPSPETSSADTVVMGGSGKSYLRYKYQDYSECAYALRYVNLNQRHAWKILQEYACRILAGLDFPIQPHDLQLVTSCSSLVQTASFNSQSLPNSEATTPESSSQLADGAVRQNTKDTAVQNMGTSSPRDMSGLGPWMSPSDHTPVQSTDQHALPPFYVFSGDALHIRDSHVPELQPCVRASFQEEPEWLVEDNPFQVEYDRTHLDWRKLDTIRGYDLSDYSTCELHYLQLPPGIALPRGLDNEP